jgi:rubrerythrin
MKGGVNMNWRQFIHVMKIDERAARAKYKAASKAAKSQAIKEIFDKLAYEEEVHVDVLDRFEKELTSLLAKGKK